MLSTGTAGNQFKRIQKEVCELLNDPPADCKARLLDEDDMTSLELTIKGPVGTPYSGGHFRVSITIGPEYPMQPPQCLFSTKIFHPNVSPSTGEICVNTLKKDWHPQSMGLKHILLTINCLLVAPNPESSLNEEAGKLMLECYDQFAQRAQQMTLIHATTSPQKAFISSSTSTKSIDNGSNEPISNNNSIKLMKTVETGEKAKKKASTLRRL